MISRYIFTLAFLSSVVFTQTINRYGSTAANFLEIGVSSNAVAMGEAYVSMADDAISAYWNPAGLANISGLEFAIILRMLLVLMDSYDKYVMYVYDGYVCISTVIGPFSMFYLSFYSLSLYTV